MSNYSYTVGVGSIESVRMDGWQNIFTSMGVAGKDPTLEYRHAPRALISDSENDSMYIQNKLYAKIVDAIPEHATRRWITFTGQKEEFNALIQDTFEELNAQEQFYELMRLERKDGGSAMIIGANDGKLPNQELILEDILSVEYLNVYSRREINAGPIDEDPMSKLFGKPKYFYFSKYDQLDQRRWVHPSRVIALRGIQLGGQQSRDTFWGYPVIERVYESVRRYGTIYGYLQMLFKDISMGVMKIKDLATLIATQGGNDLLLKRLAMVNMASSTFNAVMVDSEEEFERRTMNFSGIRDAIINVIDDLAAVAEMPLSILFGQPPSGLSTDDESGRTAFYDSIANAQRRLLRTPINRVARAIIMSKNGPTRGREPRSWFYSFNPLVEPDQNQIATMRLRQAEVDTELVELKVLSPREARSRLEGDPESPYVLDPEYSAALDEQQDKLIEEMLNPPEPVVITGEVDENGEPVVQPPEAKPPVPGKPVPAKAAKVPPSKAKIPPK